MTNNESTIPYKYRWIHRILALCGGYYWLPCPICNKNFGGHEPHGSLWTTPSEGQGVCPMCIDEANKRNKEMHAQFDVYYDMSERCMKHVRKNNGS